ncbi:MAG: AAA family ATPase [Actinobacteria bacterium]|nr:AAA family ATPase [Actinomycetota bacterium]
METATTYEDADFGPPLVQSLWRYRWLVAVAAVIGAIVGFALSSLQPTLYEATASLTLSDPTASSVFGEDSGSFEDPESVTTFTLRQADRVTSAAVLARAAKLLEGVDAGGLGKRLTVTPDAEVATLAITGSGSSPGEAARLANAAADAYQAVSASTTREEAEAALAQLVPIRQRLLTRIRSLSAATDASALSEMEALLSRLVELDTQADQIRTEAFLVGDGVEYREDATRPRAPSQPKPVRDAWIMGILGLVIGAVIAWWRAGRNRKAASPDDPATVLNAPLLGEIPRFEVAGTRVPELADLSTEAAEAYHFVVVSLEAAIEQRGPTTLLVVSPAHGDGKTTTTRMVAAAMAMNGSRVVAVDADIRTRGLTALAGVDGHRGLTDLVSDHVDVEDCMLPMGDERSTVSLIPAGEPDGRHGPGLFRRATFSQALTRIKGQADLVLVDTPTMMHFTDAFAMADEVDGLVIVVDHGTPMEVLEEAHARLSHTRTPIFGYVFNRSSDGGPGWSVARRPTVREARARR